MSDNSRQNRDVADENYFYQLHAAHGQLVNHLLRAKKSIAQVDRTLSLKAMNRIARRHGYRLRITIEPIPEGPKP